MASNKINNLVIVESPTKAQTLRKFLGDEYTVEATVGHVVDLPKKGLGVDVEHGFEPQYQTIRGKGPIIKKLKQEAKGAETILLATDPDREGEAIAYHIAVQLGYKDDDPDSRFRRVTFHAVTKDRVTEAIAHPGRLDLRRVDAQQARRILDRLVGYGLSPLLWKKISPVDPVGGEPLSAGRVQSVAVRLLVDREEERRRFRIAEYWDLRATLVRTDSAEFTADLVSVGGRQVAVGADFDQGTGRLKEGKDVLVLDGEGAAVLRDRLAGQEFVVRSVESKQSERKPYAPFITSSLQQEANRKLGFAAARTMRTAQKLYEAGRITYMRTDSPILAPEAVEAIRDRVRRMFGPQYVPAQPRRYRPKSRGAQEAHEAIRPAGNSMPTASEIGLSGDEARLYELIWKRTIASQMENARFSHLTVGIEAADTKFLAKGKTIDFAGFLRAYVAGSDDPEAALEDSELVLPPLREGDGLDCRKLEPLDHFTRPPARYTEASLIDTLDKEGVGRPSTYASIISTILHRGYARREGKNLVPTFTAFAVIKLIEQNFSELADVGFTASMEQDLDGIADGEIDWRQYLSDFYLGDDGLEARLKERESEIDPREASTLYLDDLEPAVRIGRWGPYLEMDIDGETHTASLPDDVAPADLTNDEALELLRKKAAGPTRLGDDPETGLPVYVLTGRFGPYFQLGDQRDDGEKPKRASLPDGVEIEDATINMALGLLSLPRDLGPHAETGKPVRAGIGRYGPYVVHDGDFRSLTADDDVFTVGLQRALELLNEPKRGRQRASQKVLREVGDHPDDGAPIRLLDGRYGPYLKHGKINASLPKDFDVENLTLEQAVELIAARAAKGPARRPRKRKKG